MPMNRKQGAIIRLKFDGLSWRITVLEGDDAPIRVRNYVHRLRGLQALVLNAAGQPCSEELRAESFAERLGLGQTDAPTLVTLTLRIRNPRHADLVIDGQCETARLCPSKIAKYGQRVLGLLLTELSDGLDDSSDSSDTSDTSDTSAG